MKIAISYPPLESKKGTPLLSQNRQFQWFSRLSYIYPVIPAYAATLLKENGYEVFWDDAIAQKLSYGQWRERILKEKPDIIAIETKAPVVEMHWRIINKLKKEFSDLYSQVPIFVLMGDHVTALPEESLNNSQVDYVIASGDYDFMLLNLADHLKKGERLEGGFWFREADGIKNSGPGDISKHDLNQLPMLDRELTRWQDYAYQNGNFIKTPGTYLMSGRDCWWGRCTFCSWTTLFPGEKFRTRSAGKALDEIGELIKLGVKEIMEDSGSLPVGKWLRDLCRGMIERGYNKKISISCNMRINGIKDPEIWKLMKKAGFRLVLFGIESVNQETLDRINKNLKVEEIEPSLKMCKEAGLSPHVTIMFGYPWETKEMVEKTLDFARKIFKKGYIDTLQATLVIPYPGTPLYKYCQENDLLLADDYSRFDQREPVMKSPLSDDELQVLIRKTYTSFLSPAFIARKIISIRSWNDIKFLFTAASRVLGHLVDFSKKKS